MAHRRTQGFGREKILPRQPAREYQPSHFGGHDQGAMGLRAGAPAIERRAWPRSLRGPVLARPPSSRAHDNDRIRLPPVSPPRSRKAEKNNQRPTAPANSA